MIKTVRTIQLKLKPKSHHQDAILRQFDICISYYNHFLQERINRYKLQKDQKERIKSDKLLGVENAEPKIKSLSEFDQSNSIPKIRKDFDPDKIIYSRVSQNICERVSLAYSAFFRRIKEKSGKAGFPRFKTSENRYKSITFNEYDKGFSIIPDENNFINKIKLFKVGSIKVLNRFSLPKAEKILTGTLVKKQDGFYFSITYELPAMAMLALPSKKSKPLFPYSNIEHKKKVKNEIGVDLGIRDFITTSDGDKINCPNLQKEFLVLKNLNKKLKHKKKILSKNNIAFATSRRYRSLQLKISKQHLKIARVRADFQQKAANYILSNYRNVYLEELNIRKMIDNKFSRDFSRRIHSASWNAFILKLNYKAESAGNLISLINPAWTSQICNICNEPTPTELHKKIFKCQHCLAVNDRDVNAAKNILILGTEGPLALAVPRAWLMDNAAKAAKLKAEAPSSKNQ